MIWCSALLVTEGSRSRIANRPTSLALGLGIFDRGDCETSFGHRSEHHLRGEIAGWNVDVAGENKLMPLLSYQ